MTWDCIKFGMIDFRLWWPREPFGRLGWREGPTTFNSLRTSFTEFWCLPMKDDPTMTTSDSFVRALLMRLPSSTVRKVNTLLRSEPGFDGWTALNDNIILEITGQRCFFFLSRLWADAFREIIGTKKIFLKKSEEKIWKKNVKRSMTLRVNFLAGRKSPTCDEKNQINFRIG